MLGNLLCSLAPQSPHTQSQESPILGRKEGTLNLESRGVQEVPGSRPNACLGEEISQHEVAEMLLISVPSSVKQKSSKH